MSEEDTNQHEVIIVEEEVYIDSENENQDEDSESSEYRTMDDVAAAKKTLGEHDSELTLAEAVREIKRLCEDNKQILETERKQKETLLADKQKIETELIEKNILLIVLRNYEKRL